MTLFKTRNKLEGTYCYPCFQGFPGGSDGEESACNVECYAGDLSSITGLGRSPAKGNGNPLQYSCLETPTDRGTWWARVHGIAKGQT